jgi:exoribonuclease R
VDLIPGKIRMNRAGKGFLQPDDPALKEITVPEHATGTALHEDRVLVRRDVPPKGLLHRRSEENSGTVIRVLQRRRTQLVGTLQRGRQFLYADLVVHRALFRSVPGSAHALKLTTDHISDTERNSADAERDSKDVKRFAFLNAQLKSGQPQRYGALVTDVRNMGFFVDVPELSMSGLVPLSTMEDDFYLFDPARNHLIGRCTRRIIRLGDKVEVQIANVNTFKKQVDFRLTRTSRERPVAARGGRIVPRKSGDGRHTSAVAGRAPVETKGQTFHRGARTHRPKPPRPQRGTGSG